jgi:ATP-binding cassette, subfamily B, heavy metal transporter
MPSPFAQYTEVPHKSRTDWRNLKDALPYIWDYRGRVMLALLVLLLAKIANVGVPLVLKEIVDALNQPPDFILVLPLLLLLTYGGLRLASSLFNELRDAIFAKVRYHAMRRLSNRAMSHLHSLSLRYHLERKTGALSRDMERGTRSVSTLLNYLIFNILPTAAEFLLVAAIMLNQYDWHFTFITFATVAVYVLFTFKITHWRMEYRHQMNAFESQANTQAVDSLINYETVKYFGNERLEAQRYDATLAQWEDAAIKSQTSMSALNFGQGAIIAAGVTLIMIFAAQGVVDGNMSLGDLVLVNAFLLQLFIPLNFLGVVYRAINYALADMDLMFKTLHVPPEISDSAQAQELRVGSGEVCFKEVSFSYTPERPILHAISFRIAPGQKVAIVGPSGSGKSTLARLLFRFYDVDSGMIMINGQDIRAVTQDSLRAAIGIVPQDTVLFNDTLLYNIAYAKPNATIEEIRHAANLAYIDDFIQKLPQGYDTIVGERGLKLSGGEKQRVAIARVILKNPHVLLFDEATSALDSHAEQVIQNALHKVAANHTTLVIAHRLSTIVDADEILVMEHGRIVERGKHTQLLATHGVYAHMWALQQEERALEQLETHLGA